MVKRKTPSGGSFDFDEFAEENNLRKAIELANQQADYRSL